MAVDCKTRKDIELEFRVNDSGTITSLGVYYEQMVYVPYFYELAMDGKYDEVYFILSEDRTYFIFEVTEDEVAEFPELRHAVGMIIYNKNGYVHCTTYMNHTEFMNAVNDIANDYDYQGGLYD